MARVAFDDRTEVPRQVERDADQLVLHAVSPRRAHRHVHQAGWVGIAADREFVFLFEHELMEALHRSRGASLEFDRNDAAVDRDEVVDLSRATVPPLPKEQLGVVAGVLIDESKLLSGELISHLSAKCRRKTTPRGERSGRRCAEERVK
jgi:hypothetical protein